MNKTFLSAVVVIALLVIVCGIRTFRIDEAPSIPTPTSQSGHKLIFVPNNGLTFNYTESSKQSVTNETTRVTFTVNATYNGENYATINYSEFYLKLYAVRFGLPNNPYTGRDDPQNSGSFTIDPSHPTKVFQLIFEFDTYSYNGIDTVNTTYELQYSN